MQSFRKRLELLSLKITPAVLSIIMVLLAAIPLHFPGAALVMPVFTLINIYYWNTFYAGALPLLFLFVLGILQDTLAGLPLGVSSFVNIVFALMLMRERHNFGKTVFGTMWLGFVSLSLLAFVLQWLIMSIYMAKLFPMSGLLLQWVSTCLAYPPVHLLLSRIYRAVLES